jgi:CheY-like chemotaxis protein
MNDSFTPPKGIPPTAIRILVADDDPDMRNYIAEPLRQRGCQVIEVEDGLQLLDFLGTRFSRRRRASEPNLLAPRIVISDVLMPGCDGLTALSSMRRWGWNIPVILVSANDDPRVLTEGARLNVSAYFQKPFSIEDLCDTVEALLAGTNSFPAKAQS